MWQKYSHFLSPAIIGAAVAIVQPQIVGSQELTEQAIASLAKEITVVINGQNPGSGIIIGKKDQTYYVLTAKHVVATQDGYEILTADGAKHPLDYRTVKKLPGVDLALAQFTSNQNYRVAEIGDSDTVTEGITVYTAGWPHPGRAITERIYQITAGKISGRSLKPLEDGYALIYTNITRSGMSGGPVLDAQGRVIGIHGRAEGVPIVDPDNGQTIDIKSGFNLGIPSKTFLELAAIADIPPNPSFANLLLAWGEKIHKEKNYKAAADYYKKALNQDAKLNVAHFFLGLAKYEMGDTEGAIRDWQTVDVKGHYGKYVYRSSLAQLALAVAMYGKGDRQTSLEIINKINRPDLFLIDFDAYKEEVWGDRLLADTKKMIPEFLPSKTIENSSPVFSIAITPDGQTLATGHNDKTIKLWNVKTGESKRNLTGLSHTVSHLTISPDGQTLAAASDSNITLWNISTGEVKTTLTGNSTNLVSLIFSPDNRTLASAGDNTVKLWDVNTGQVQATFTDDVTSITSVNFSPDSQTLASVNRRGNINLWNIKTKQINKTINSRVRRQSAFYTIAFSPDGQVIARTTPDNIELLKLDTQQAINTINPLGNNRNNFFLSLLTNGKSLVAQSALNTFSFWDINTGKLQRIFYGNRITHQWNQKKMVALSSDGKTLASADGNRIWIWY